MSDDYDALGRSMAQQDAATNTLAQVRDVPPSAASTALAAQKASGYPAGAGMFDPASAGAALKQANDRAALTSSPGLARWVATAPPAHVAAAQDDLPGLAKIANQLRDYVSSPWRQLWEGAKQLGTEVVQPPSIPEALSKWDTDPLGAAAAIAGRGSIVEQSITLLKAAGLAQQVAMTAADPTGAAARTGADEYARRLIGDQNYARVQAAISVASLAATAAGVGIKGGVPAVAPEGAEAGVVPGPGEFASAREAARSMQERGPAPEGTRWDVVRTETGFALRPVPLVEPSIGVPPEGVSPEVDAVRSAHADLDADAIKRLEDEIDKSPLADASSDTMRHFLEEQAPGESAYIDAQQLERMFAEEKIPSEEFDKLAPTDAHVAAYMNAQDAAGEFGIPLSDYLTWTKGQPWADEVRKITRFSGDVSQANANELWKPEAEPTPPDPEHIYVPPPIAHDPELSASENAALKAQEPAIQAAAKQATQEIYLKGLFSDAKALGMNEADLKAWSTKVQAAQQQVYERLIERAKKQIKQFQTPKWKVTYNKHYADVSQDYLGRPAVVARNQLTSSATEGTDLLKDNGLVSQGKPITFYRATNYHDTKDGEVPMDLFTNPRPVQSPHPYWKATIDLSSYRGASFAEDPHFTAGWSKGSNYVKEIKGPSGEPVQFEKRPVTWIAHVKTQKFGDYRRPADVEAALDWYVKKNPQGQYEDDQDFQRRIRGRERALKQGSWPEWESPEMMKDLGWDAVRMVENPGQKIPNIFVTNPETIFWKYDLGTVPTKIRLALADRAFVPKDLLDRLPRGIWDKNGAPVDEYAEQLGFDSGHQMLKELASIEDLRGKTSFKEWLERQIKAEAAERAKDELNWDLSPAGILEQAKELVDAPQIEDLLTDSLRAIAHTLGDPALFNKETIKTQAEEIFRSLPMRDATNLKGFTKTIRDLSRKVEQGLLRGKGEKLIEGFKARQEQLLNYYMLSKAFTYARLLRSADARFKTLASKSTVKSVDQQYFNHVLLTLKSVGYDLKIDARELESQTAGVTPQEFVNDLRAAGYEINYIAPPTVGELKDLSVDEFDSLRRSINSLYSMGKDIKTVLLQGERAEVAALVNAIVTQIRFRGVRFTGANVTERWYDPSHTLRALDAALVRPENFWLDVDQGNPDGPAQRAIVAPLQAAKHLEAELMKELNDRFKEFLKGKGDAFNKGLKRTLDIPELTFTDNYQVSHKVISTASDLVHAVLHLGNANNAKVLLEGLRWNRLDVINAAKEHLTPEELDLVNLIWGAHEFLWPKVEAAYRELAGVAPPKYEAVPFTIGGKQMTGGYVELRYNKVLDPMEHKGYGVNSLFGPEGISTLPGNPFAKLRSGYIGPQLLSIESVMFGLRQVVHDVAQRKTLLDVAKVALHPEVIKAIHAHYGPEFSKQVRPYLEYIARQSVFNDQATAQMAQFIRQFRANATATALAFRFTTPLKHFFPALFHSVSEVGAPQFAKAVADLYSTPWKTKEMLEGIVAESVEMRTRWANLDRDLRVDAMNLLHQQNGMIEAYQHLGYLGIAMSDMFSSAATYIAEKRNALEQGHTEAWAIHRAEQKVRMAHGAATETDLPAVLRESKDAWHEVGRLLTIFQSFLNVSFNRQWTSSRLIQLGQAQYRAGQQSAGNANFAKSISRIFWSNIMAGLAIGAVLQLTSKKQGNWIENLMLGVTEQGLGGIPILSNIIRSFESISSGATDMATEAINDIGKGVYDIGALTANATGFSDHLIGHQLPIAPYSIHDGLQLQGFFTGLGVDGLYDMLDYGYSIISGEAQPQNPADVMSGLAHGVHKPEIGGRGRSLRGGIR